MSSLFASKFNTTIPLLDKVVNHEKAPLYGGLFVLLFVVLLWNNNKSETRSGKPLPPVVPHTVPILGKAVPYGVQPVTFLQECMQKFGDCFTFTMMGRKMTFCLNPDGNHFVFNVKLSHATAEGAYDKLTVPVFGTEVVYDVPNSTFMEQKKFVKDALTTSAFKTYVPIIIKEARDFFGTWADKKEKLELFPEMAELTIRTASHCLMGKEIRDQLHSNVAKLYHDLDGGFQPINVFFRWLPLPNYIKRDRANRIMTETFLKILKERRDTNNLESQDVLQSLMDGVYRDGSKMSDEAIAHMMIATLMAGQHTSSTSASWILFELANNPDALAELIKEQSMILTGRPDTPAHELPDFTYEELRKFTYLDCVMKESLRLHTPIHTVMRLVVKDIEYKGYTIPAGHFLCGSQAVSQMDAKRFPEPEKFDPTRWTESDEGAGEWTINGVDIAQKSARSNFLPFGAGRHRCIGEAFAYIQIKTIIAMFVREFTHDLVKETKTGKNIFPEMDFTSLVVIPKAPGYISYERRPELRK